MTGPYVIGCDVGSQGTNAALYAADGTLVASAYEAYDLAFPNPGWAGRTRTSGPRRSSRRAGGSSTSVRTGRGDRGAVVRVAARRDGGVRRVGPPPAPALIWMDRRAEAQAAALAERISPADFYRAVGANLDSSHAVFKALWVRDEEPDLWRDAASLQSPGTYVLRHATGVTAVDHSNASSLALLDPRTRTWSEQVLAGTEIDLAMLPSSAAGRIRGHGDGGVRRRRAASLRTRSSRSAARRRWRRRSAPACSSPARCATSSAPPSPSARRAPSRARTRRCSSSAIRTPTPTRGCSRTRGSSPAATSGGGETSSRRRSAATKKKGSATRTTSSAGGVADPAGLRRRRVPPGDAGRDGARMERRRARRVLRAHARAHARPHDARDPRGARSASATSSTR